MLLELLFYVALFVLIVSLIWYQSIPPNLPPGPSGLPLFGVTFQTYKAQHLQDNLLKWKQQYGPIFKFYVMNRLVVVLGSYESIHEAFVKQGDTFSGRQAFFAFQEESYGLTDSEGDAWKARRRFSLSTLRDFGFGKTTMETKILEEIDYLIKDIEKHQGQPANMHSEFTAASLNVVFRLTFGRRFEPDEETFVNFFEQFRSFKDIDISCLSPFMLCKSIAKICAYTPMGRYLAKRATRVISLLKKEIEQVAANYQTDDEPTSYIEAFVQMRSRQPENQYFNDQVLISCLADLLGAGSDTTATTAQWALLYLAKHPEVQARVYEELRAQGNDQGRVSYADRAKVPYTEATITEVQRCIDLTPHSLMHRCTAASKLYGYDIPEDALVMPIMSACLHDEGTFTNPDQFCPERFLSRNVSEEMTARFAPFGIGRRRCLGESLAKMELFLLITTLVARFQFSLPTGETISLNECQNGFLMRYPPPYKLCAKPRL